MIVGDEKYLKHFRQMVLQSLICGLNHPVEWIESYSRCIAVPNEEIPEIDEFCNLAIKELYFWNCCSDGRKKSIDEVTMDECNEWINKHYKQ